MTYRITRKGWRTLLASVYFIFLGVEIWILLDLKLSVAPGLFNMDHWIIGLLITAQAGAVLAYLLVRRRWG